MQRNLGCAAMLSATQKEGDFAGARVVLQAFSNLIECNSHFHQVDTYFLLCTLLKCSYLKIIIAPNLSACELRSSYEQIRNKLLDENLYDAI